MKKTLETTTKIRFQDCDPHNHLNNSKYLDYFINAREDQVLENYDIDIFKMMKTELKGWVVISNQIVYLRPAITMETVILESQIIAFTDKSLKIEMKMYNADKTELKSLFWANYVHFDIKNQKSSNHSEHLMSIFNAVLVPVFDENFESRIKTIKQLQ